ncbi:MAG TPA: hypothetical protein VN598_13850 [Usitatibacter sp.]|nr:hypothetical protein [Usitatibacter sp.]
MVLATLRAALAATAFLFTGGAIADSPRHVDELLHKSGIWKQAGDLPGQLKAGAEEAREKEKASGQPATMTDAEYSRLVAAMARAFSPDRMRRIVAREIERNLPAADEAQVLRFLSTDLGVRATKAEEEASDPATVARMRGEVDGFFIKVPGARVAKITRLAQAFKAGESAASMMIDMAAAVAYGAAVASPNGDERVARDLRRKFEERRGELTDTMNQQLTKVFAYTYRSLSDEDLDRYLEFAQTPAAQHFTGVTIKAFDIAFQEGGLELGRYIGREAGKNGRSS